MCGLISGLSSLFLWSMFLFLCQYHTVWMTVALQYSLKSRENTPLEHLFDVQIRNEIESEDARVFKAFSEGPFDFQKEEIDCVRFFTVEELKDPEWRKEFTPCLIGELERLYGQ